MRGSSCLIMYSSFSPLHLETGTRLKCGCFLEAVLSDFIYIIFISVNEIKLSLVLDQ